MIYRISGAHYTQNNWCLFDADCPFLIYFCFVLSLHLHGQRPFCERCEKIIVSQKWINIWSEISISIHKKGRFLHLNFNWKPHAAHRAPSELFGAIITYKFVNRELSQNVVRCEMRVSFLWFGGAWKSRIFCLFETL